jgi:hypothetical protein
LRRRDREEEGRTGVEEKRKENLMKGGEWKRRERKERRGGA